MDGSQPFSNTRRGGRQSPALTGNGKHSRGITKHRPQTAIRKNARLGNGQHQQQQTALEGKDAELKRPLPSLSTSNGSSDKALQNRPALKDIGSRKQPQTLPVPKEFQQPYSKQPETTQRLGRKRERSREAESSVPQAIQDEPTKKRPQVSHPSGLVETKEAEDKTEPSQEVNRKRKRLQEAEDPALRTEGEPTEHWAATSDTSNKELQNLSKHPSNLENPCDREAYSPLLARPRKKAQTSLARALEDTSQQGIANNISDNKIKHWAQEGSWPKEFSEQDNQSSIDLQKFICVEDYLVEQEISMAHLLARKKSSAALRRNNSEPSIATPSDQQPREEKSAPYTHPSYETLLATKGSYMSESKLGITSAGKKDIQTLLNSKNKIPDNSLFSNGQFQATCAKIRNRNEARLTRDISLLLVPSAEILETQGATHLEHLIESINEGWNNAIPATKPRPQPDFSVGFRRSAFTIDQLQRLEPFVGSFDYTSFYMATWQMYFPFLTCELKGCAGGLDIADRQNAHSMTLAVRGVVELFRYIKREKEIDREILAFSISHDHSAVRIYGHYAVIQDDNTTTFHRHPIREFIFTEQDGRDKWTTYNFTKNVYDIWMPTHLKRICSAIDEIPLNIDFGVSLGDSFTSVADESVADELERADSQEMAASAPSSQNTGSFKKPRLPPKVIMQQELDRKQQDIDEQRQHIAELRELLRQQPPSNASTGNESEGVRLLQQENERLRQEAKQEMDALKEQMRQEMKQRDDKLDRLMNMIEQRI